MALITGFWLSDDEDTKTKVAYEGIITSRGSGWVSWKCDRATAERVVSDQMHTRNEEPDIDVLAWAGDEIVWTWENGLRAAIIRPDENGWYEMPGWCWEEVHPDNLTEDCDVDAA